MAYGGTAEDKFCTFCEARITDKSYRSLMSKTSVCFHKYLQELDVSSNGYLCRQCFSKLNRLIRLDSEIETKLESLKKKRILLLSELKAFRKEIEIRLPSERPILFSCGRKATPRPVIHSVKRTCVNTKPPDISKFNFKPILPLITQSQNADKESECLSDSLSSSAVKNENNRSVKKRKSSSTDKDVQVKKLKTLASKSTKPQPLLQFGNDSVLPNHPVLLFRNVNTVSDDTLPVHMSDGTCQAEKGRAGTPTIITTTSEGTSQCFGQSPFMLQKTGLGTSNDACNVVTLNLSHIPEKNQVHAVDSEEAASQTTHQNNVYSMVIVNPAFGVQNTQASVSENSEVERTGSLQYSHKASSHSSKEATPGYVSEGESSAKDPFSYVTWSNPKTENKSDTVQQNSNGDVCPETVKIKEEPEESYYLPTSRTDGEDVTDKAEPQSVSSRASQMLCIKQEPKFPSNRESQDIHHKSLESKLHCVNERHVLSYINRIPSSDLSDVDVSTTVDAPCTWTMKSELLEKLKNTQQCGAKLKNSEESKKGDTADLTNSLAVCPSQWSIKQDDSVGINDSLAACPSQCYSANSAVPALFADNHWLGHTANDKPIIEETKQSSTASFRNVEKCEQYSVGAMSGPKQQLIPESVRSLKVARQSLDKAIKESYKNSSVDISSKEGCAPRCDQQRRTTDHTSSETIRAGKGCVYTICVKQ